MNNKFGEVEGLGTLNYRNVYAFYDEPLMFSCKASTGRIFLFLREENEKPAWLVSEVSDDQLELLEDNAIEMRTPFLLPESGNLFMVTKNNKGLFDVRTITAQELTEGMLPFPGEYLDYDHIK